MIRCGDQDDGYKIARAAGCHFNPAVDRVIANADEEGVLRGGALLQAYTGVSINVHMAGFDPHWANRDLIWSVFYYAFVRCNCHSIFAQVPANNETALAIDKRLGFIEVAHIPEVFPAGEDLIVMRMRKEECRWLKVGPKAERLRNITF